MKKVKDFSWLLYAIILAIAVLASSCGSNEPQPEITITQVDTKIEFPYTWDSIKYNRIIINTDDKTTSIELDTKVTFNEEFIEIVYENSLGNEPIIWIGGWTDKTTFTIDNNLGTIIINHNTGFMTIHYNHGMKEIYTY